MRVRRHLQRPIAGFSVLVSVLVLATFSLVLLLVLQQRRAAEVRQVKQALQARLEQEVENELLRLSRPGLGTPGSGARGAVRVHQAIDNVLARSFDEMLALERRREALRRTLRRNPNVAQRRQLHQQLRQIGKELEVAKLWILMLEDRRLTARRLEKSQGQGAGKPSPGPVETPPASSAVPQLPDWLSSLQ